MKEYFSPHLGLVCLGVLVFSLYALALAHQPIPEVPVGSVQVEGIYEY